MKQPNELNKPNRPDFILRKVKYYREGCSEKHLTDIANIVGSPSDHINFEQLQNKIKDYALEKE